MGILDFWTPANHYSWSRSRYGHHVSASVVPVSRFKLLSCSKFTPFMPLHCYGCAGSDVHSIVLFTGTDNSEIDNLRSRKITLERTIIECDESVKALQCELKQIENAEANYHRQRVCWNREKVVSVVCILSVLWKIVMYVFMWILAGSDS